MRAHLGAELPDELWIQHLRKPLRVSMGSLATDPEEATRMTETYVTLQRRVHDEMVCHFPEALKTVDALRGQGIRLGVVTSKGCEMTARTLVSWGLAGAFDVLVTAADVRTGKPHPEPVLRALSELGLARTPGDVVFVGDSHHDVVAGQEAGVRTAAVLWGTVRPDSARRNQPRLLDSGLERAGYAAPLAADGHHGPPSCGITA